MVTFAVTFILVSHHFLTRNETYNNNKKIYDIETTLPFMSGTGLSIINMHEKINIDCLIFSCIIMVHRVQCRKKKKSQKHIFKL